MKEKAGLGLSLAAVLTVGAGVYMQSSGRQPSAVQVSTTKSTGSAPTVHASNVHPPPSIGGCSAYAPPSNQPQEDENRSSAYKVIETFVEQGQGERVITGSSDRLAAHLGATNELHYVIAVVPDPRHTHLSLTFDRFMEAIESAAEDDGFAYDSSWMPWKTETKDYARRKDESKEEERVEDREACPGVLLFRKQPDNQQPDLDPYKTGLIVFVVGEQPTRGLNLAEWENAINWLESYSSFRKGGGLGRPLRILGPSYSGTLPSLEERIRSLDSFQASGIVVASGTVTGFDSIDRFKMILSPNPKTKFFTFQENQTVNRSRLVSFLYPNSQKPPVAFISEDETAYGSREEKDSPQAGLELYYPRDISGLRSAYQKEDLFNHPVGSPEEGRESVHTALSADLSPGASEEGDTVPNFSRQSTMGEEAELYGIVSQLRSHHIEHLLLSCSNSIDCLFLTRFFHHTYPEGRVIVTGADLLFRREVDTTEFRGTLALTDYSLVPRSFEWTGSKDNEGSSSGHIFQSSDEEGVYLAGRALFGLPDDYFSKPHDDDGVIDWPIKKGVLADFDHAGWARENENIGPPRPDTWLTAIGRDGYWPVAVFNDATAPQRRQVNFPSTIASLKKQEPDASQTMWNELTRVQTPLAICALVSFGMGSFHLLGSLDHNLLRFSGLDGVFRRRPEWRWQLLFGLTGAASIVPIWSLLLPWLLFYIWFPHQQMPGAWVVGIFLAAGLCLVEFFVYLWGGDPAISVPAVTRLWSTLPFALIPIVVGAALWGGCFYGLTEADKVPFFYRAVHLTTGVSPLLPLWIVMVGFYLWCLHSLKGNGLLTEGMPLLPQALKNVNARGAENALRLVRTRISGQMAERINDAGTFLMFNHGQLFPPLIFLSLWGVNVYIEKLPIRTFETAQYGVLLNLVVAAAVFLAILDGTRMVVMWLQLKRMLYGLARTPLRRTFRALRDITVRSLWELSANVPRSQYQLFWRQLEAAETVLKKYGSLCPKEVESMKQYGEGFRAAYLGNVNQSAQWWEPVSPPKVSDQNGHPRRIREVIAECTARFFFRYLESRWEEELPERTRQYLDAVKPGDRGAFVDLYLPLSKNTAICAAEEFVCLTYVSYIQNTLARIRSLVFSMSTIFVAATLAIATYPVAPKPSITMEMLMLLVVLASAVAFVYAGMERDTILSDITDTTQELGWEFYKKYLVFLIPPLLALLSAQFPALGDFIFGWIQPDFAAAH